MRNFGKLDEEVIYINLELEKGRSITSIALEDYGYKNESSLRKKLTKNNIYKRVGNKFTKQNEDILQNREIINEDNNVRQSVRHYVTPVLREVIVEENKPVVTTSQNVTDIIKDSDYAGLISNYEIIMRMVEDYKNSGIYDDSRKKIIINLPLDTEEERITFRINKTVYNEFQEFAKENKQFKIKELVSAALKEFIDKYR